MRDPNTSDWTEELEPKLSDISILGWCLVAIRAVLMLSIILIGIVFLFIARGLERPFVGPRRPISGQVVKWVCRIGARAQLGCVCLCAGHPCRIWVQLWPITHLGWISLC